MNHGRKLESPLIFTQQSQYDHSTTMHQGDAGTSSAMKFHCWNAKSKESTPRRQPLLVGRAPSGCRFTTVGPTATTTTTTHTTANTTTGTQAIARSPPQTQEARRGPRPGRGSRADTIARRASQHRRRPRGTSRQRAGRTATRIPTRQTGSQARSRLRNGTNGRGRASNGRPRRAIYTGGATRSPRTGTDTLTAKAGRLAKRRVGASATRQQRIRGETKDCRQRRRQRDNKDSLC